MTQELYELPKGWEWHQLKNLCSFENGDRGKNYPSRAHFVDKGIPVISARALNGWKIEKDYINYITKERYDLLGSGKIKKGDVLFCLCGSLGKAALVEDLDQGAIASSLVIVRANSEILNSYLLFYFNSGLSQKYIQKYNNGAAQPNLSANSLAKFYIPAPNVDEQQRLVKKLDTLLSRIDTAIAHLQHSLELNDQLFASSLNQAFNPLDAEVQPDGTYQLPEGWEWKEVKELATLRSGTGFPKNQQGNPDQKIPFLKVSDMNIEGNEVQILSWNNSINEKQVRELKAKPMPTSTVIFPKIGAAIFTNKKRILCNDPLNSCSGIIPRGKRHEPALFTKHQNSAVFC